MLRARKAIKIALPTAAALGAGAAIAVGSIPGSDKTITGCYAGTTGATVGQDLEYREPPGALRVIDPSLTNPNPAGGPNSPPDPARECQGGETQITWNQTGPQGPTGPTGPTGSQGLAGGQGASGAPGTPLIGGTSFGLTNDAGLTFLKLDGIKGESLEKGHVGDLKLDSFSLGAQGAIGSATGGAGAGKVSVQTFTITKPVDKTSPLLLQDAITGSHIKEAVLEFTHKLKGSEQDYLKLKIDDLLITSVQDGTSSSGEPQEQVTFDFLKIKSIFLPQGHKGAGETVGWNVVANKAG